MKNSIQVARESNGQELLMSVNIVTRNRSKTLLTSLETISKQSFSERSYEIVVVDNASKDDTKSVVENFAKNSRVSVRYIFEPRVGNHNARNRGIIKSRADIIVFTDDDIEATNGWLSEIYNEFAQNPEVGVVGGRVRPDWGGIAPSWVYGYGSRKTHPLFAYLDYGEKRKVVVDTYLFGNNMAIKKEVLFKTQGWYPDVFPPEKIHFSGTGEAGLIKQIRELGLSVVYLPKAIIYHLCPPSRATREYFIYRYRRWAVENVYNQFRFKQKGVAALYVCAEILTGLLQLLKMLVVKLIGLRETKKYNLSIKSGYVFEQIKQLFKVLSQKDLYSFITKKSYLDRRGY